MQYAGDVTIEKFQFLLVRLKGFEVYKDTMILSMISIPTGTIKSSCGLKWIPVTNISIPTGTIKSISIVCTKAGPGNFNSYWYD